MPLFLGIPRLEQKSFVLLLKVWRATTSIPMMAVYTTVLVLPELWGYAKLYDNISEHGWGYWLLNLVFFLVWSDSWIYW